MGAFSGNKTGLNLSEWVTFLGYCLMMGPNCMKLQDGMCILTHSCIQICGCS